MDLRSKPFAVGFHRPRGLLHNKRHLLFDAFKPVQQVVFQPLAFGGAHGDKPGRRRVRNRPDRRPDSFLVLKGFAHGKNIHIFF